MGINPNVYRVERHPLYMPRSSGALRQLLDTRDVLVCPGIHDSLSARIAELVGFDALYLTGYGTSVATVGYPDVGLMTKTEMVTNATNVQESVEVPVICDADDGYGNAVNTISTVKAFIRAGIAGIHIEDQVGPKGSAKDGKSVIPLETMEGKMQAAADTRDEYDDAFVLIGRTDVKDVPGGTVDDVITRLNALYAAGADYVMLEGEFERDEVDRVADEVDAPLVYPFSGGLPVLDVDELDAMGYDILIYPLLSTAATIEGVYSTLAAFSADEAGSVRDLRERLDALPFDARRDATGLQDVIDLEDQYVR